ncbi:hypothetical protein CALVIDRAFT_93886 [Calocera viscosa TUFC12733]|uniref:Uncharacterized protein n=1 Tax=Calocera viscosa (strain TUFC12733) TaxID=1330018 RepID=A0A167MX16_CALVF|nr:hypothetical protein CALVIDRAFT_93886 [Calocera viscosa TUFC12733]
MLLAIRCASYQLNLDRKRDMVERTDKRDPGYSPPPATMSLSTFLSAHSQDPHVVSLLPILCTNDCASLGCWLFPRVDAVRMPLMIKCQRPLSTPKALEGTAQSSSRALSTAWSLPQWCLALLGSHLLVDSLCDRPVAGPLHLPQQSKRKAIFQQTCRRPATMMTSDSEQLASHARA